MAGVRINYQYMTEHDTIDFFHCEMICGSAALIVTRPNVAAS